MSKRQVARFSGALAHVVMLPVMGQPWPGLCTQVALVVMLCPGAPE